MRRGARNATRPASSSEAQTRTAARVAKADLEKELAALRSENVRLSDELREALEQQSATADILKVISRSGFELQPVLDALVESAARLCQAERAFIHRFDGELLRTAAAHNASPELVDFARRNPIRVGVDTGAGRAALLRRAVHIEDVRTDPDYAYRGADIDPIRTVLAVPMVKADDPVGVMIIYRLEVKPFTDRQHALLETFADQAVIAIENARLFEEVQARTRELSSALEYQTATSDVLNVISRSAFDLPTVLETLTESAARLCEADMAGITRQKDGTDEYYHETSHNAPPEFREYTKRTPVRRDRGSVVGRALLEGAPVQVPDVLADEEYAYRDGQSAGRYRTILGVPLLREGNPIGVIFLARSDVRPFTDRQIELVQTFADQAVIAIENVRLFEEVQARTRELTEALEYQTATSDVLNVISRSPAEIQPVLETIVETARRLCEAYDAIILLREGESLSVAAHRGPIPVDFARWPIGRGWVTGRAVVDRKTVHVTDLAALRDEFPDGHAMALRLGHRTILTTPLLREDVAIGAIVIRRAEVRPFSDRQVAVLQTFADQAVIAMENARLFQEVQARTREVTEALEQQTATSEVLQVINASPGNLAPVFDAMLAKATQLCNAKLGIMWIHHGAAFTIAAERGTPAPSTVFGKAPVRPGPTTALARIAREKRVLHIPDMMDEDAYRAGDPMRLASVEGLGMRSWLGVPLLKEGKLLGVFTIYRDEVRPFLQKEIALLTSFADQAVIAIENARLFEEVQARTRELTESLEYQTATSGVLNVISRSPNDLQPVLDTLAASAARLCEAVNATIFLREGETVVPRAHVGPLGRLGVARPLDRSWVTGRAVLDRRTIHIPDLLAVSDDEYPQGKEMARAYGHRATLATPLIRDGAAIGAILVRRDEARPFSHKQVALLETFANQAVIAINNVALFEEVQARTEELSEALAQQTATADVLKTISRSTFDLQTVLHTLVESAARLCEADKATITRQRDGLFYRAEFYGFSQEFMDYVRTVPVRPERSTGTGRALLEGRTVHIADVQADPDYTWSDAQKLGDFRTLLGVPMLREGVPIGVLTLTRSEPRPFSEKQIELVSTFADQAAIAIENVRLFESLEARTAELAESLQYQTATSEVLGVISRSPSELKPVLDAIVSTALLLCDAYDAVILIRHGDLLVPAGHEGPIATSAAPVDRDWVAGRAVVDGEMVHVSNLLAEEKEFPRGYAFARKLGHRTTLAAPLKRADGVIGVLVIRRLEERAFSEKQISVLQTFADQAVIAIENARLFESLEARTKELARSLDELRAAQDRLVQTEKLAALGQLTAGVAHEIKNPLNFVNNFADLSSELIEELRTALRALPADGEAREEVEGIAETIRDNLKRIVQHGRRADSIVKNMLLHSRESGGERRAIDLNASAEEALNLAYHGARAENPKFNITFGCELDPQVGTVEVFPQEFLRVLLNLISNGFYAARKRQNEYADSSFEPELKLSTKAFPDRVEIRVRDNGIGIPEEVKAKMFNPFFTTKAAGEGTGLGLSLSHDIVVKQHGGSIEAESVPGEFTEFTITLPRRLGPAVAGAHADEVIA